MGKRIRIVGVEKRGSLPPAEKLARDIHPTAGWIRERKAIIHYAPGYEEHAKKLAELLQHAFNEIGLPIEKIELREAEDHPDGDQTTVHTWLGKKKLEELALHVGLGPFTGMDRHGRVEYRALASASLGGTLAVHPELLNSPLAKELIIHELLHLLGLKHEHDLPIMNPLRPVWEDTSKNYVQKLVAELLRLHGIERKKKPWWRFW